MSGDPAVFSQSLARRVKNVVEESEKHSAVLPTENKARLLAGHTSPVEITAPWTQDGNSWKCRARRLFRIDGVYQPLNDGVEFDVFHPTTAAKPELGIGERVFAVFRGVWELVSGAPGGAVIAAPSTDKAAIVEPCRRPLFRNVPPNPNAYASTPEGNAYRCMGTIKLPDKTYEPIKVSDTLYLKARVPRTGIGRFVVRKDGKTSEHIDWVYIDGTPFDENNWATTDDPEKAQYNYDPAICYNLDWSELLIEGDKVEYIERKNGDFTYYEVQPLAEFITAVEGQADVVLQIVKPTYKNDKVESFDIDVINSQTQTPPDPPDFEAVFLKLKSDRCTPETARPMGICNDCMTLRVRGLFIRTDANGRRYPMLFETAQLRAGGAIRAREANCYYKTENDNCSPNMIQPEMKLQRLNEWRLSLSSTVHATTCTELND
jgi:hypothetical protein